MQLVVAKNRRRAGGSPSFSDRQGLVQALAQTGGRIGWPECSSHVTSAVSCRRAAAAVLAR